MSVVPGPTPGLIVIHRRHVMSNSSRENGIAFTRRMICPDLPVY